MFIIFSYSVPIEMVGFGYYVWRNFAVGLRMFSVDVKKSMTIFFAIFLGEPAKRIYIRVSSCLVSLYTFTRWKEFLAT